MWKWAVIKTKHKAVNRSLWPSVISLIWFLSLCCGVLNWTGLSLCTPEKKDEGLVGKQTYQRNTNKVRQTERKTNRWVSVQTDWSIYRLRKHHLVLENTACRERWNIHKCLQFLCSRRPPHSLMFTCTQKHMTSWPAQHYAVHAPQTPRGKSPGDV